MPNYLTAFNAEWVPDQTPDGRRADWPQEVHRFPSGVTEIIERQAQKGE